MTDEDYFRYVKPHLQAPPSFQCLKKQRELSRVKLSFAFVRLRRTALVC